MRFVTESSCSSLLGKGQDVPLEELQLQLYSRLFRGTHAWHGVVVTLASMLRWIWQNLECNLKTRDSKTWPHKRCYWENIAEFHQFQKYRRNRTFYRNYRRLCQAWVHYKLHDNYLYNGMFERFGRLQVAVPERIYRSAPAVTDCHLAKVKVRDQMLKKQEFR